MASFCFSLTTAVVISLLGIDATAQARHLWKRQNYGFIGPDGGMLYSSPEMRAFETSMMQQLQKDMELKVMAKFNAEMEKKLQSSEKNRSGLKLELATTTTITPTGDREYYPQSSADEPTTTVAGLEADIRPTAQPDVFRRPVNFGGNLYNIQPEAAAPRPDMLVGATTFPPTINNVYNAGTSSDGEERLRPAEVSSYDPSGFRRPPAAETRSLNGFETTAAPEEDEWEVYRRRKLGAASPTGDNGGPPSISANAGPRQARLLENERAEDPTDAHESFTSFRYF